MSGSFLVFFRAFSWQTLLPLTNSCPRLPAVVLLTKVGSPNRILSLSLPLRLPHLVLACLLFTSASAQTDQQIYTDSLQNNWQAWGWAAAINYNNTSPVHSGADSISFQINSTPSSWDAIYIHTMPSILRLTPTLRFG
jgi:hypothetical protein